MRFEREHAEIDLDSTRKAAMTRGLAERHAALPALKQDRPISRKRLAYLRDQIVERGIVMPFDWISASVDGTTYRLNGAHSSLLLAGLPDEEFPRRAVAIISKWNCASKEAAAELYASIDPRQSARSCPDIYRVMLASTPHLSAVTQTAFDVCAVGIAVWKGGSQRGAVAYTPYQRASLAAGHGDFVKWVSGMLSGDEAIMMLKRSPVVAAMFGTWTKNKAEAELFWREVVEGNDMDPAAPTRKLQKHLLSTKIAFGRGAQRGRRTESPDYMAVRCLRAWNAWRTGMPTNLKVHSAKFPDVV